MSVGLIQFPESTFTRFVLSPGNLDEAFVQGEVVTDRVLPSRIGIPIVLEVVLNPFVYGR